MAVDADAVPPITAPPGNTPEEPRAERIAREPGRLRRWLLVIGPGVVTGASDDDPSGIATYAVAGASFGFATLWLTVVCLPLMASVQYISAKMGMVRGEGLAATLIKRYPRWLIYPAILALAVANTLNAGADIGAIGAAIELIVPIPIVVSVVPIAVGIAALQVFGSYRLIASVFKWLALALVAYVATAFFVRADVGEVLRGTFVPDIRWDAAYLATVVAIVGTTISPYLWFWQSSQEVDEEICQGRLTIQQRRGATNDELKYRAWDVNLGMFFSELVAYFIIFVTAATLFKSGHTNVNSATDAAEALRPLAGDAAKYLLAVGLIGAGLLAVPVLTGASAYSVGQVLGWNASLDAKPRQSRRFYAFIALATLAGVLINFVGINPIDALVYSAVLNGLLAAPLLVLMMLASADPEVMGDLANGAVITILGWATTVLMGLAAVVLIGAWVFGR